MYITLGRFYDDVRVERSFSEELIVSEQDILYNLELYKYCNCREIVDIINETDDNLDYTILDKPMDIPELNHILKKFDVYAKSLYGKEITIVYDKYNSLNRNVLELDLSGYKVKYQYITPFNHKKFRDGFNLCKEYQPMLLFTRLLLESIKLHVTDIHFGVKHLSREPSYHVDFRVLDDLVPCNLFELDKTLYTDTIRQLVFKKSKSITDDLNTFDGLVTLVEDYFGDGGYDLRVTAVRCVGGLLLVARLQGKSTTTLTIDKLGFDEQVTKDLKTMERLYSGLTLITGSVRTGKNTTAFAIANELIKKPLKLLDVSSPVETLMSFPQIDYQNNPANLYKIVTLVKKLDTDVVFINEIPDSSVAKAVQDLVNSSVGVVTTFHFDRIWHFPYKLKEYYGDSMYDIMPQINGVFTQKMFVKQCSHCREEIHFEGLDTDIVNFLHKYNINRLYVPKGCPICNGTGLAKGVQPYSESMVFTPDIKTDLLGLNSTNDIEKYIKNYVMSEKRSLEFKLADAVSRGDLNYKAIYKIL